MSTHGVRRVSPRGAFLLRCCCQTLRHLLWTPNTVQRHPTPCLSPTQLPIHLADKQFPSTCYVLGSLAGAGGTKRERARFWPPELTARHGSRMQKWWCKKWAGWRLRAQILESDCLGLNTSYYSVHSGTLGKTQLFWATISPSITIFTS